MTLHNHEGRHHCVASTPNGNPSRMHPECLRLPGYAGRWSEGVSSKFL